MLLARRALGTPPRANPMRGLGQEVSGATTCGPGRNEGRPQPSWWPRVRAIIIEHEDEFPPGIDLPFLGAWIEHESSGRHDLRSSLDEVGYFQVHPAEIEAIVGAAKVPAAMAEIQGSPEASVRWGAALLRHYAEAIDLFKIPHGTALYHALLKVMHSSRPRGKRWLAIVEAALGRPPRDYNEFLAVVDGTASGVIPPAPGLAVPDKMPSCAPTWLLRRRDAFIVDPNESGYPSGGHGRGLVLATQTRLQMNAATALLRMMSPGLVGAPLAGPLGAAMPGVMFAPPLPVEHAIATSGWGRPREYRNGTHEGIDFFAPEGVPVLAVESGTVERVTTGDNAGLFVEVRHRGGWLSRYMHLSRADVHAGERVLRGQVIGAVGTSGTDHSNPHLHFALRLPDSRLAEFVAAFGEPRDGFGSRRGEDVSVPSEPVIPVAAYKPVVVNDAVANGIPLYTAPSRAPAPGLLVGALGAVALGGAFWFYRRRGGRMPTWARIK